MKSRDRALEAVRPSGRRGVEIGPLNRPLIHRTDGDILYADHLPTEALRRKYAGHAAVEAEGTDPIVTVDLVLQDQTLAQALGSRGPVDYIVAAHVIEHIADPIGWLRACADALTEEGVLFLVVPDKRFTFDHLRTPSTTGDLIGRHLDKAGVPTPAQVFEHCARAASVDIVDLWSGGGRHPAVLPGHGLASAWHEARTVKETGIYRDVHCSVFTPFTFAEVMREVITLDLVPFTIIDMTPTPRFDLEFFATLRKSSADSPETRAAATPRLDAIGDHELPEPPRAPHPRNRLLRRALSFARRRHTTP